jgi:hypothetical protein
MFRLYIIIFIVLFFGFQVYQSYESICNRINLLEIKVKELEFLAFNK